MSKWLPPDRRPAAPRKIELIGVDDSEWVLHGEGTPVLHGVAGIVLASVRGIYHPQRSPISQQPAFYPGAIPGDPKTDPQKIDLKLTSWAPDAIAWEQIEEAWWRAVDDEADATLRVWNRAHTRYRDMPVRVETYPDDAMDFEPDTVWDWDLPMIAYSPGWRGQTIKSVAGEGDESSPWTEDEPGVWSATITLGNPGDLPAWAEFSLSNTGIEEWKVPDGVSGQSIELEQFPAELGPIVVNSDPFTLQLDSEVESQIAATLLGLRFRFPIPARTAPTEVSISVTGGPGEATAYVTPMWKRPW